MQLNVAFVIYESVDSLVLIHMDLANRFDYSFKFILVGDTAVGKTSIIGRFVENRFDPNH